MQRKTVSNQLQDSGATPNQFDMTPMYTLPSQQYSYPNMDHQNGLNESYSNGGGSTQWYNNLGRGIPAPPNIMSAPSGISHLTNQQQQQRLFCLQQRPDSHKKQEDSLQARQQYPIPMQEFQRVNNQENYQITPTPYSAHSGLPFSVPINRVKSEHSPPSGSGSSNVSSSYSMGTSGLPFYQHQLAAIQQQQYVLQRYAHFGYLPTQSCYTGAAVPLVSPGLLGSVHGNTELNPNQIDAVSRTTGSPHLNDKTTGFKNSSNVAFNSSNYNHNQNNISLETRRMRRKAVLSPGKLRTASVSVTQRVKPTSSRFRGVSWHKRDKKWVARVWTNGKILNIGCFPCEEAAALMVDLRNLHDFPNNGVHLNFPDVNTRNSLVDKFLSNKAIPTEKMEIVGYKAFAKSPKKGRNASTDKTDVKNGLSYESKLASSEPCTSLPSPVFDSLATSLLTSDSCSTVGAMCQEMKSHLQTKKKSNSSNEYWSSLESGDDTNASDSIFDLGRGSDSTFGSEEHDEKGELSGLLKMNAHIPTNSESNIVHEPCCNSDKINLGGAGIQN